MRRLFGTDGIRGEAGVPPLDGGTVSRVGAALGDSLRVPGRPEPVRVVVGGDTRESTGSIVAALTGGLAATGARVAYAGVVPTPAVAWLVTALDLDAGISVSASHNPWRDNGIKLFSPKGRKLPDEVEAAIECRIDASVPAAPRAASPDPALARLYVHHLAGSLPHRLDGLTVVLDAANGAAFEIAPAAFRAAGARVVTLAASPDGRNINERCGALHPEAMARAVVAHGADLGLALDGDADRIVLADGSGRLLDGDDVLYLWTHELIRESRKPAAVVGTVMSNFGLERALSALGVALLRAPVGDRYVVEEMEKRGALLGGEPSGHLIRSDLTTTGDGTLTGLHLAALVAASGKPLASQPRFDHTPQVLKNVRVRERVPLAEAPALGRAVAEAERCLDGAGRILVRYSGTEPLLRIMVEGPDAALVESLATALVESARNALGAA
ncbi:MAG TPA: phosphoglucosamine mutase [Thermoanaerobaculia bacterium]|nr:phosphoglucosamine mutase [Thermoanaerobaculia bacterium]